VEEGKGLGRGKDRREEEKVGRGGKGSAEKRSRRGRERRGGNKRRKVVWGEHCFMLSGGIDATAVKRLILTILPFNRAKNLKTKVIKLLPSLYNGTQNHN
jgi:hypothetical protein